MIQVHKNRGRYQHASTGRYFPLNPQKYKGTYPLIFKSSLELLAMKYLDKSEQILSWSYENISIKYFDKANNKVRKYYIDFVATAKVGKFLTKNIWIEIKSKCETVQPKNKNNINAMTTYLTNQCKWQSAKQLAESKGYQFVILTEEQLKN